MLKKNMAEYWLLNLFVQKCKNKKTLMLLDLSQVSFKLTL